MPRHAAPRLAALAVALALPAAARGALPGDPVVAQRLSGAVELDGRLEEPGWDLAPVYDGFVQQFPTEGAAPSERTEVRVLYDDRALYVGVTALDRTPGEVKRPLGRRDRAPASDAVTIFVDSMRDRRTAFVFELSVAGVQTDGLLLEDDQFSTDWDAVWDGAAAAIAGGWSAELRIPLSALRFSAREPLLFGFGVKRTIARRHETILSVAIPRSARGQVARLGDLVGLRGLRPVRSVEIVPYTAARASIRPRGGDGEPATPRLLDPVGDLGIDVRASLGRALALQGTLNPDFGQVEADEIVQNLSTFEVFFPEKRPFFTQGMDLFQPVAPPGRTSPQQLFYSRRIGLDAPILAAAKLSGKVSGDVEVGVVEAFVAGAGSGGPDDDPPRTFRFDASQPLRLGPASALPTLAPAPRNLAAAVARWRPSPQVAVGASATSAALVGPACTAEEAARADEVDDGTAPAGELRPRRCDVIAGSAAALDASLRSRDGAWYALGQLTGSVAEGGAPIRVLPDGTSLARGDAGFGAHAAAGRSGGEPWRYEVHWEYASPTLELNAVGFQRTQNEQLGRALLRYVRPGGGGPFHSYALQLGGEARRTTDGRGLMRGAAAWLASEFQLRSFHWFGGTLYAEPERWDVREIDESGAAMRRPGSASIDLWFSSDASKALFVEVGGGGGRTFPAGPLAPLSFGGGVVRTVVRPHPRAETRLDLRYEWNAWRARWIDTDGGGGQLFGDLRAPVLSATLRQQLVLTRHLTLQAYAQLFTTYGRYGAIYQASAGPGGRVRFTDLRPRARPAQADPADPFAFVGDPDFRAGALNVSAVLRWEYRLGSTLFVVYSRGQLEPEWEGAGSAPHTLRPWDLARGPTTDTFLVKWSRWYGG
jgi:hypothetical protein